VRVTEIAQSESSAAGGWRRLACRVVFDDGGTSGLWFEWTGPGPVAAAGDALLAVLLPCALAVREDLRIDGAVSAPALATARERVQPTLARFHPGYGPVDIQASDVVDDAALPPPARGVAAFYSGGLDSSYTLTRHRDRITHLGFVHGLDLGMRWKEVRDQARADVAAIASRFDLGMLDVATRIRSGLYREVQRRARACADQRIRFLLEWSLGCLLAGLGQLLSGSAGRLLIAGSWNERYERATGSHPDLEPAWSTPRLAIELDGVGVARPDKALYLAEHDPALLRGLRICQARPLRTDNCGRCPKCLRLRMELRVAGIPPELHPFDEPVDDGTLRRSFVKVDGYFWPEILRRARARGDHEAARTAEIMMERRFHLGREIARLRERRRHPGWQHLRRSSAPGGT